MPLISQKTEPPFYPFDYVAVANPSISVPSMKEITKIKESGVKSTISKKETGFLDIRMFGSDAFYPTRRIVPDIADIKIIEKNGSPKVIMMMFNDGTTSKVVLDENDVYSLDTGLGICWIKRLISADTDVGSSVYNKLVSRAKKFLDKKEANEKAEAKKAAKEKESLERKIAKKKKRDTIAKEKAMQKRAEEIVTLLDKVGGIVIDKAAEQLGDINTEDYKKFMESLLTKSDKPQEKKTEEEEIQEIMKMLFGLGNDEVKTESDVPAEDSSEDDVVVKYDNTTADYD